MKSVSVKFFTCFGLIVLLSGLLLSSPAGATVSEIQVNTYTTSDQGYPSTAMDANGNFEVIGASGEHGIVGETSGTGAAGLYGVNTTDNNYGILGYDTYGVYGESTGGWVAFELVYFLN